MEPESFSPKSAHLAIVEMYDALPKSKRGMFIGHLNESLVVLAKLVEKAGLRGQEEKTV